MCILSSCGIIIINDRDSSTDTDPSESAVFDETLPATPPEEIDDGYSAALDSFNSLSAKKGADGTTFFIAGENHRYFSGDGTESVLNSDRVARIKLLEEKLGCTFYTKTSTSSEIVSAINESVKSGEIFTDVIAVPASDMGVLIYNGLLTPLNTVPNFDLNADFFDANSKAALTLGEKVYGISGDGCFEPEKTECLIYNETLARSLGVNSISQFIADGEWTVDKYNEVLQAASSAYGELIPHMYGDGYEENFLLGTGTSYVSCVDITLSLNIFSESFSSVAEKFAKLFKEYPVSDTVSPSDSLLFTSCTVSDLEKYKDSTNVWSVAPFPKADKSSEYSTPMASDSVILCLPVNVLDAEYAGDFIECFNAISKDYLKNRYITYLANYVLRNESSVVALEHIFSNTTYDFSVAVRNEYTTLNTYTAEIYKKMLAGSITADGLEELRPDAEVYWDKYFSVTSEG